MRRKLSSPSLVLFLALGGYGLLAVAFGGMLLASTLPYVTFGAAGRARALRPAPEASGA